MLSVEEEIPEVSRCSNCPPPPSSCYHNSLSKFLSLSPLLSRYISHFTHSANWPRPPQPEPPPEYQLAGKTQTTTTKNPSSLLLPPATEAERRRRAFPSAPGERLSPPPPQEPPSARPPARDIKKRSGGRNAKPAVGRPLWSFLFKPFFPPPLPTLTEGNRCIAAEKRGRMKVGLSPPSMIISRKCHFLLILHPRSAAAAVQSPSPSSPPSSSRGLCCLFLHPPRLYTTCLQCYVGRRNKKSGGDG